MSPLPLAAVNGTLNSQAPSFGSTARGDISTIVFGVLTVAASIIGIWQAYKAWSIWQEHHHSVAVVRNGRHPTVESHGTQATDAVHHVSDSIALTDMARPHAPHPVPLNTSGDMLLPVSNTGNRSQTSLSTVSNMSPTAHPVAHPSPPEDPVPVSGQGEGHTQDLVSSTMSGHPSVGYTAH